MRIAVGADHAGFELKARLADLLRAEGHEIVDLGTNSAESVDYPDFAAEVARAVSRHEVERGLLVCGTGIGMAMTAGKVEGVRAATCHDRYTAEMARAHNNANVLTLGARVVDGPRAEEITRVFFDTAFEGGRHERRVSKIDALD